MHPYLQLGSLSLPSYGLMAMAGALTAFFTVFRLRKTQARLSEDNVLDALIFAVFIGLLGAKVLYLIKSPQPWPKSFRELWDIISSGLVFYGGLIGGLSGIYLASRKTKQPFLAFTDLIVPGFCFAHAFGRIGCLLAGCCYGVEHEGACSVVIDGVSRLAVQPMEAGFLVLLGSVLVFLYVRKRPRRGVVTGLYMVLYAVWRFIIEFWRADDRGFVGALSTSQFIGIFIFAAGGALLVLSIKKGRTRFMDDFEALIPFAENLDAGARLACIKEYAGSLVPELAAVTKNGETALNVYASFLFTALMADGKLTDEEYALIGPAVEDFFGENLDYAAAKEKAEQADAVIALKAHADSLIDILGETEPALKEKLIYTSLLLTAADGHVCDTEKEYLRKLIQE